MMIALALLFAMSTGISAQGWLNKLKDKATQKITNKIDSNVDKGMDKVLDKAEDEATGVVKGKTSKGEKTAEAQSSCFRTMSLPNRWVSFRLSGICSVEP